METFNDYQDVLIRPVPMSKVASRANTNIYRHDVFPVCAANMEGVGTFSMARVLSKEKMLTFIHKHYSRQEWDEFIASMSKEDMNYVIPTSGVTDSDIEFIVDLHRTYNFKMVCFDVANGHTEFAIDRAAEFKREYPMTKIAYGNVANPDVLLEMRKKKFMPDFIKVGIGPGSVCTTRLKTGIGVPQLSLVEEFVQYCDFMAGGKFPTRKPYIIADGGIRNPGDVAKALVAGADLVMVGGYLSGHTEGGNTTKFFGSSSRDSLNHDPSKDYVAEEGKCVDIIPKGGVIHTIKDLKGSIRSTLTYLGVDDIKDIKHAGEFIAVNRVADNY